MKELKGLGYDFACLRRPLPHIRCSLLRRFDDVTRVGRGVRRVHVRQLRAATMSSRFVESRPSCTIERVCAPCWETLLRSLQEKLREHLVPDYRLYLLDELGHIRRQAIEFHSATDEAAIEHAQQYRSGADMELWQRSRLVKRIPKID